MGLFHVELLNLLFGLESGGLKLEASIRPHLPAKQLPQLHQGSAPVQHVVNAHGQEVLKPTAVGA